VSPIKVQRATIAHYSPINSAERLLALDVLRGFALLGILLVNIEFFQRPLSAIYLGFDADRGGLDLASAWFTASFVMGKFYTLFSLLFGLGFILFLDRAAERSRHPRLLFLRRLLVLGVIGAGHAFLIWSGDILLTYAAFGLLLLLFAKSSARKLLFWGAGLQVFLLLMALLAGVVTDASLQTEEALAQHLAAHEQVRLGFKADIEQGDAIYASGSWADVISWRVHELKGIYATAELIASMLSILGMFLIGAAMGRAGLFQDIAAAMPVFRGMLWVGYGIGLPCTFIYASAVVQLDPLYIDLRNSLLITLQMVGNVSLCLAYMSTLVVLLHKGHTWLHVLAPAGRMALSNYLMHSLVLTTLFYGYGLGLYGRFGHMTLTLMALALFGFQLWFSRWWLERYRMGPMEWLWRGLTYGRVQPW
jgi:uncharacterized protein